MSKKQKKKDQLRIQQISILINQAKAVQDWLEVGMLRAERLQLKSKYPVSNSFEDFLNTIKIITGHTND